MTGAPDDSELGRRARQARARAVVRGWEYRQRRHAKGVWFRLRRLLAGARLVYAIGADEARTLIAEGFAPEPAGLELAPPRTILVVPEARARAIAGALPVRPRLIAELLGYENLVLVPFGSAAR